MKFSFVLCLATFGVLLMEKSANGTIGTVFTNGNKTLNAFLLRMVPLVAMVLLVDHMVEFSSY